jgi:hypothetical protein
MRTIGRCFKEFQEFPVLRFDPNVFGFVVDSSDRDCSMKCPMFATESGRFQLWWNWPKPEEREMIEPMARFAITEGYRVGMTNGMRDDRFDNLHFKTESIADLVKHLLVKRYADKMPILQGVCTEIDAREWFAAMEAGEFGFHPDDQPRRVTWHAERVFTDQEAAAVSDYVAAIRQAFGDRIYEFAGVTNDRRGG